MLEPNLSEIITRLESRIIALEQKNTNSPAGKPPKRMLTTEEAATFLGMTVDGLRGLTYKKLISYYKPNGKEHLFRCGRACRLAEKESFRTRGVDRKPG